MELFQFALSSSSSELSIHFDKDLNSQIFIAYVILCVIIKKPVFLLAFFISCMLFEASIFDGLKEKHLYLITFVVYSYVFSHCETITSKICCVIILLLSITFAYDAAFYGIDGYYGESETLIYRNIESLAIFAHTIFIYSLIPYRRIRHNIQRCIDFISGISLNSAYMLYYWYNTKKETNGTRK